MGKQGFRPVGSVDNSPAIYRWEGRCVDSFSVPSGRSSALAARFGRPYGTYRQGTPTDPLSPAVNCWAIVVCPSGTKTWVATRHLCRRTFLFPSAPWERDGTVFPSIARNLPGSMACWTVSRAGLTNQAIRRVTSARPRRQSIRWPLRPRHEPPCRRP